MRVLRNAFISRWIAWVKETWRRKAGKNSTSRRDDAVGSSRTLVKPRVPKLRFQTKQVSFFVLFVVCVMVDYLQESKQILCEQNTHHHRHYQRFGHYKSISLSWCVFSWINWNEQMSSSYQTLFNMFANFFKSRKTFRILGRIALCILRCCRNKIPISLSTFVSPTLQRNKNLNRFVKRKLFSRHHRRIKD